MVTRILPEEVRDAEATYIAVGLCGELVRQWSVESGRPVQDILRTVAVTFASDVEAP
jgi:hypothetical protein